MVSWICGWGLIKNCLKSPNFRAKILHQDVQQTDRFPAHPYHHLLIDPDDDNQWLFGDHLDRGGHGGLDLWLGFDQKLPQEVSSCPTSEPKSSIRMYKRQIDFLLIHTIIS
jgi:hypothetical protein